MLWLLRFKPARNLADNLIAAVDSSASHVSNSTNPILQHRRTWISPTVKEEQDSRERKASAAAGIIIGYRVSSCYITGMRFNL